MNSEVIPEKSLSILIPPKDCANTLRLRRLFDKSNDATAVCSAIRAMVLLLEDFHAGGQILVRSSKGVMEVVNFTDGNGGILQRNKKLSGV